MRDSSDERTVSGISGWLAFPPWVGGVVWTGWSFYASTGPGTGGPPLLAVLAIPALLLLGKGFLVLDPNMAAVCLFFGKYAGTLRVAGFHWLNPCYQRTRLSLRANNLNTPIMKVNDRAGNPIEVAAMARWLARRAVARTRCKPDTSCICEQRFSRSARGARV